MALPLSAVAAAIGVGAKSWNSAPGGSASASGAAMGTSIADSAAARSATRAVLVMARTPSATVAGGFQRPSEDEMVAACHAGNCVASNKSIHDTPCDGVAAGHNRGTRE